jgi:hypothetical protein
LEGTENAGFLEGNQNLNQEGRMEVPFLKSLIWQLFRRIEEIEWKREAERFPQEKITEEVRSSALISDKKRP